MSTSNRHQMWCAFSACVMCYFDISLRLFLNTISWVRQWLVPFEVADFCFRWATTHLTMNEIGEPCLCKWISLQIFLCSQMVFGFIFLLLLLLFRLFILPFETNLVKTYQSLFTFSWYVKLEEAIKYEKLIRWFGMHSISLHCSVSLSIVPYTQVCMWMYLRSFFFCRRNINTPNGKAKQNNNTFASNWRRSTLKRHNNWMRTKSKFIARGVEMKWEKTRH